MASQIEVAQLGAYNRGTKRLVFQNPRGNKYYYAIYEDIIYDQYLEYSTDGTTWSNSPQLIYGLATGAISFDVKIYDSGSDLKIFLVLLDDNAKDLTYIRGSLSDAGTTPVWDTPQDINANLTTKITAVPQRCGIARTDNGRLVVAYNEDYSSKGNNFRRTYIIGSDGDGASPNWSNAAIIDDPSGDNNNDDKGSTKLGIESFSSSYPDRVMIYGRVPEPTATNTYQWGVWVYDWNGSSMNLVTSDYNGSASGADAFLDISGIIDSNDKVHIIVGRPGTDYLYHYAYPTTGGLGSETGYQISNTDVDAISITLDSIADELYCFYHHDGDSTDYHYKKTDISTISWGSEQDITISVQVSLITTWSRDIENALHIGLDGGGFVWYDTLQVVTETTAYKDITLKTSFTSATTYKDITLKTTLESIPTFKDIILKTTLDALDFKDIILKTTLESIPIYKDIVLKTTLDSLDFKDIVLKTSFSAAPLLDYKDIILKTSLESALTYKDIALKTTLESIPIYKDITLKITLDSLDFKDIALKVSLEVEAITAYKDIILKTSLESALTYKDITLKTTFESIPIFKDITIQTTLDSLDFKDIAIKISLESEGITDYKDITLKTSITSALTHKDITLKTTLDSLDYKDINLKITLDSLDHKDITLKTTLESALTYKDVALKTTIESALTYKDILLKTTFESIPTYKDVSITTSLESNLTYKDVALKTTLESIPIYKDVGIKTSLSIYVVVGYKDISIKVSLEAIPTEIVNFTSAITQTEDLISVITQTEDLISVITQTENFISKINS